MKNWSRPYHEARRLLDVLSGDSQEQDRGECRHQQRDRDDGMCGSVSHEVQVRGAAR